MHAYFTGWNPPDPKTNRTQPLIDCEVCTDPFLLILRVPCGQTPNSSWYSPFRTYTHSKLVWRCGVNFTPGRKRYISKRMPEAVSVTIVFTNTPGAFSCQEIFRATMETKSLNAKVPGEISFHLLFRRAAIFCFICYTS